MLYFQTVGDVDGQSGQTIGTLVHGELTRSFAAAEYRNLPVRLGQRDVRRSIWGPLAAWDATRGGIPLLGVFLSTQTRRVQGEQGGFDATRRAHLLVISFQWGGFNTLPICFHCHPEGSIPPFSKEGSFSPLLNIILYLYYVYT